MNISKIITFNHRVVLLKLFTLRAFYLQGIRSCYETISMLPDFIWLDFHTYKIKHYHQKWITDSIHHLITLVFPSGQTSLISIASLFKTKSEWLAPGCMEGPWRIQTWPLDSISLFCFLLSPPTALHPTCDIIWVLPKTEHILLSETYKPMQLLKILFAQL